VREVIVYSRDGCHLCEVMLQQAVPVCAGQATLIVRDVDSSPEWLAAYGLEVPVLLLDGQEICRYEFDVDALRSALANGSG